MTVSKSVWELITSDIVFDFAMESVRLSPFNVSESESVSIKLFLLERISPVFDRDLICLSGDFIAISCPDISDDNNVFISLGGSERSAAVASTPG